MLRPRFSIFPFSARFHTRWPDNDMNQMVSSSHYHSLMDTLIDYYLQIHGGIHFVNKNSSVKEHEKLLSKLMMSNDDGVIVIKTPPFDDSSNYSNRQISNQAPQPPPPLCFCSENSFRFFKPIRYPQTITMGLGVSELGRASAVFRVGVLGSRVDCDKNDEKEDLVVVDAIGKYVHVFVDAETQRPVKEMPKDLMKEALEKIRIDL